MTSTLRWCALFVIVFGLLQTSARAQNAPAAPPEAAPAAVPPPAAEPPPPPPPPPPAVAEPAPPPPMAPPPPAAAPAPLVPSQPPFKIETPNKSTVRIGLLLQPQYQAQSSATLNSYSQDLYIRRTRVLIGGTLFGAFDYFFDTDYPNLFFANREAPAMAGTPAAYPKATPGLNIQDAFGTWKALGDMLKVDVGYMLPPMSHNAVQGATTLYAWDYFAYTFQHTAVGVFNTTASSVGRDTGVQLRGLVLDGHLEYRAGLFQGRRNSEGTDATGAITDVGSRNFFRFTARVQANLLDAEPGFFYAGTYLGAKKILSVGGAIDIQDSYRYYAGDVFLDMPLGPGVVTGQVDYSYWNGHSFITALPKQSALAGEVGFLFLPIAISPIFRFDHLWSDAAPNTSRYAGGLAFWPFGHNSNLKAFYTNIKEAGAPKSVNQINIQWQLYFF
jgi:hypothetical protein